MTVGGGVMPELMVRDHIIRMPKEHRGKVRFKSQDTRLVVIGLTTLEGRPEIKNGQPALGF